MEINLEWKPLNAGLVLKFMNLKFVPNDMEYYAAYVNGEDSGHRVWGRANEWRTAHKDNIVFGFPPPPLETRVGAKELAESEIGVENGILTG